MTSNRRAMLLMLAFVTLWVAIEALAARLLHSYSPYQVVWTRYAVHLALMLLVWGWREPASLWRTRRPVFQIARSLLMLGMPASWILGMQMGVPSAAAMGVFWLSPLLILGMARLFLRDSAAAPMWTATAVAFAGSLLMHEPSRPPSLGLMVFPLGMAMCFSLYVVMTRSLRTETLHANLFYTAVGVFVALSPAMPGLWITPMPHDFLAMAGVGVLGFVALYLLDRMTDAAPVSVSAPFAYVQVALTASLALVAGIGHDVSGGRAALGLFLIVGAVLFAWVRGPQLRVRDAVGTRTSP